MKEEPMEREPYEAPAEPVVVGSVEASAFTFTGSGSDYSIYSSLS